MFKTLLVPVDRSPLAEQAIGQAAAIARASHATVDLVLAHEPLPYDGVGDAPWSAEALGHECEYVESIAREVSSGASVPVSHAVVHGAAVEMICQRARDVDADLIVMTSHGRTGLSRAWLGSVADGVLRRSAIPVLLLRPVKTERDRLAAHTLFAHVIVPLDASRFSTDILPPAAALAHAGGAHVTLLRVVQPVPLMIIDAAQPFRVYSPTTRDEAATERLVSDAKQHLDEIARTLSSQEGLTVETRVVVGEHVAAAIIDVARGYGADVIAMSTHGRGASRLLLGSVADKVLRASGLPMLLHRPIDVIKATEAADRANGVQPFVLAFA